MKQTVFVSVLLGAVSLSSSAARASSISGTISPSNLGAGTLVRLSGIVNATTTARSNGQYSFSGLTSGTYTVMPSKSGFTFSPTSEAVTIKNGNVTGVNFTIAAITSGTISGTVSPSSLGSGALITLSGSPSATTVADSSGNYSFTGLPNGTFTLRPSRTYVTFSPANQMITINNSNAPDVNFAAQSGTLPTLLYPDLSDIIPGGKMSISGSGSSEVFQYTHDTFNGGPGPLVIQPVYNPASGTYQGTQYIYSLNSSGTWTLAQTVRVAGAFIFDAAHDHFHFPFTTYGLYSVGPDGGPGTAIATSGKVSFCIDDSFIFDPTLPNAGALGNLGSCSDPTSLRGLDIGAVDEYDQTDEGQSISIPNLPDGTYWLRAIVDPDNFLAEADKTNNETDVEFTVTGTALQVLQTVVPVLQAPPIINVTSPVDGASISGTVQLSANTATMTGVQYLVDGQAVGNLVTTSPYSLNWNTATVPNGNHWLAAQTTGSTGRIGTSPVVSVTVSNTSTAAPTVTLSSPTAGSTVSGSIILSATVASSYAISTVSFFVDNVQVGMSLTAPPYVTYWDTEAASTGQHTITVWATDITGNTGTSAPVTVTVDNSHPANLIGKDVTVSVDGLGLMQTPKFSTTKPDLLVAFVSYDGPSNGQQIATVFGAGLNWVLVERSNFQLGDAEIWAATSSDPLSGVTVMAQPGVGTSYHGSLTVIAFSNASGPGIVARTSAPSGGPDCPLPGIAAGNWVFAVGNDWDNPIARIPANGQVLVHQRVDTQVGDTYWVQSTTAPSTAYALIDIHDSSPTTDEWNYAAVEIVATRP